MLLYLHLRVSASTQSKGKVIFRVLNIKSFLPITLHFIIHEMFKSP